MKAFLECVAFAALTTALTIGIFALYAVKIGHPII